MYIACLAKGHKLRYHTGARTHNLCIPSAAIKKLNYDTSALSIMRGGISTFNRKEVIKLTTTGEK